MDYKTDIASGADLDRRMDGYRIQGGVYALLVGQVTGREVARLEFVFAGPREVRLIEDAATAAVEARALLAAVDMVGRVGTRSAEGPFA